MDCLAISNFMAWWIDITTAADVFLESEISLICWIMWLIWKSRNDKVFNFNNPNPLLVIESAMKSNNEFWALNFTGSAENIDEPRMISRWIFP